MCVWVVTCWAHCWEEQAGRWDVLIVLAAFGELPLLPFAIYQLFSACHLFTGHLLICCLLSVTHCLPLAAYLLLEASIWGQVCQYLPAIDLPLAVCHFPAFGGECWKQAGCLGNLGGKVQTSLSF